MWLLRIANLIALSSLGICIVESLPETNVVVFCAFAAIAVVIASITAEVVLRRNRARAQTNQQKSGVQFLNAETGKAKLQEELGRAREISAPSVSILFVRLKLDEVQQHLRSKGVRNVVRSSVEHIKPLLRQVDWIARVDTNDLLIVLPNAAKFDHAALGEALSSTLSGPVHTGGESIEVKAFVSVLNADPTQTADQVLEEGVRKVTELQDQWQPLTAASFKRTA